MACDTNTDWKLTRGLAYIVIYECDNSDGSVCTAPTAAELRVYDSSRTVVATIAAAVTQIGVKYRLEFPITQAQSALFTDDSYSCIFDETFNGEKYDLDRNTLIMLVGV